LTAQRFALFLEAAPDAILEVDNDGRIVLANDEAERMFQASTGRADRIAGRGPDAGTPARIARGEARGLRGTPYAPSHGPGLDLYAVRKDGTEFAVDINLSPLAGVGSGQGFVRDPRVSERRAAEEKIRSLN